MQFESFYQSKKWRNLVDILKAERVNEQGLLICERCGLPIIKKYDCIGHHKIELTEDNYTDASIALNPDNIQLIHFHCHNMIHERFEGFKQNVYLVYGAPCSGKTTYVNEHAHKDDLILDVDRIWTSVCNSSREEKPDRLKANVFGIRDLLIEQVKMRKGNWRNAYVIGTYPLATDRQRLCQLLRAREIFIDEPQEVCLARAENDNWKNFIREWFEDYTA